VVSQRGERRPSSRSLAATNTPAGTRTISHGAYRAELVRRFWEYVKAEGLRGALFEQTHDKNPHRPPVFKPCEWHRNLVLPPGDDGKKAFALVQKRPHHRWFRSMTSSQALVWSVFGSLAALGKLGLLSDLASPDGSAPPFPPDTLRRDGCHVEYEVDYLGEPRPTSIDVMLGAEAGRRVAVECKLSETDVGTCSRPRLGPADASYCNGQYRPPHGGGKGCALTEIRVRYWQHLARLTSWREDQDMDPCPLRPTYQLARNVLAVCAKPDGSTNLRGGHCVLLVDERNPAFREGGRGHDAAKSLAASLKEARMLRLTTWQNVIERLRADSQLDWLVDGLHRKYGF
jgi:hypothetical protein